MKHTKWITAIVAVLLVAVACGYFFISLAKKQENLIPLTEATVVEQAVTFYNDGADDTRFYDVTSPFFISKKMELPSTDINAFLRTVSEPVDTVNFDAMRDIWLKQENGYSYMKVGYSADVYYVQDMATNTFYAVTGEQNDNLERLLTTAQTEESFLKGLLILIGIMFVLIAISEWSKSRTKTEKTPKSKTKEEFFVPLGVFFATIVVGDFYGATHALLVAATLFIFFALNDIKENKSHLPTHILSLVIALAFLYGSQMFFY